MLTQRDKCDISCLCRPATGPTLSACQASTLSAYRIRLGTRCLASRQATLSHGGQHGSCTACPGGSVLTPHNPSPQPKCTQPAAAKLLPLLTQLARRGVLVRTSAAAGALYADGGSEGVNMQHASNAQPGVLHTAVE